MSFWGFSHNRLEFNPLLSDNAPEPARMFTEPVMEPPHITVNWPCTSDVSVNFVTATQCWQLLHSNEILQMDFSQLIRALPCSLWVNRFLIDLAFYVGRPEDAQAILKDTPLSNVDKNLRHLSLTLQQPTFSVSSNRLVRSSHCSSKSLSFRCKFSIFW